MLDFATHAIDNDMSSTRERQVKWFRGLLEETGMSIKELCREADITSPNIYRFNKDTKSNGEPNDRTLDPWTIIALARGVGKKPPLELIGLDKGDAILAVPNPDDPLTPDLTKQPNLFLFRINTDLLDLSGLTQDDLVLVDTAIEPAAGDLVLALDYKNRGRDTHTLIRIFAPPFLTAPSTAPELRRPKFTDAEDLGIQAVLIRNIRSRELRKND